MSLARKNAMLRPNASGQLPTAGIQDLAVSSTKLADAAKPIGVSQTWQDVTASRSVGVTYTNTTGRSIVVAYSRDGSGATYTYIYLYIDGSLCVQNSIYAPGGYSKPLGVIGVIPNGSTYRFDMSTDGGSGDTFRELR